MSVEIRKKCEVGLLAQCHHLPVPQPDDKHPVQTTAEKLREKMLMRAASVTDDLGRESIAVVARRVVGHRSTLPATVST